MRYLIFWLVLVVVQSADAIILVGGGNAINTTDPGNGTPWDEVARITNSTGTHTTSGSAVHLGGGYMLTANHVNLSQGFVSFDGSATFQIEAGSARHVTGGTDVVDLKVFRLANHPGTSGVNLLPREAIGYETAFGAATHIGWGVGHDPADTSNPWIWGNSSTSDKRWGVNDFSSTQRMSYSHGGIYYRFQSLVTTLDSDATANEAAATLYDSGSGLFIKDDADQWYLAATMVTTSKNGSSTFATDSTRGRNYSVRIAEYSDQINAFMVDPIAVPEASEQAFLLGLVALGFIVTRRRSAGRAETRGCRPSL